MLLIGYPAGITSTGILSAYAWLNAPIEFSAPAASCITKTPNFFLSFVLEYPSAAINAPLSCLNATILMSSLAAASIKGLLG